MSKLSRSIRGTLKLFIITSILFTFFVSPAALFQSSVKAGAEPGMGDEIDAGISDAIISAYKRNKDEYQITGAVNDVFVWYSDFYRQDFYEEGGKRGAVIYSSSNGAVYVPGNHVSVYSNTGDYPKYGLPLGDPFVPNEEWILYDSNSDFINGKAIQYFKDGFIGYNSIGGGYKFQEYYPIVETVIIEVDHYDPISKDDIEEYVAEVTVYLEDIYLDPTNEGKGEKTMTAKKSFFAKVGDDTLITRHFSGLDNGASWRNLDINKDFEFVGRVSDDKGYGYMKCDSYKMVKEGEDPYQIKVPLNKVQTYKFTYTCEGQGGGPGLDTEPPVIVHNPASPKYLWQNGTGWAIIAAEITDNVGVAGAQVILNGEICDGCVMSIDSGNTYFSIVPLKQGRNNYYIRANDYAGNFATHPESGPYHTIISEMSALFGTRPWVGMSEDPVNTAIGNFVYNYTDISVPSIGPDFEIDRWFNHQSSFVGDFGAGWSSNFDMEIAEVDNPLFSGAQLRYPDGRTVNFEKSGLFSYKGPDYNFDELIKAGPYFRLTLKDQTEYYFNNDGKLSSIVDRDGNTLVINRDGEKISNVKDAGGRVYIFNYSGENISSIEVADLGSFTYSYEEDNLKTVTDPEGRTVTYVYGEEGCIDSIISPEGRPFLNTQTCNEDGQVEYQLGGTGFVNEFTYEDDRTIITDPFGNTVTHVYDEDFRVIEKIDELGKSEYIEYNDANQPIKVTDKNGNETTYEYDDNGNLLKITDAYGLTQEYTYNEMNFVTSIKDKDGSLQSYEYDEEGHLLNSTGDDNATTQYEYDENGNITKEIHPNGAEINKEYDEKGNLVKETDPFGAVTTYGYDLRGNVISVTDALGNTTTIEYNSLGLATKQVDPLGNVTTFEYDSDQNLIKETNPLGHSKTYTFDDNNRLISETDYNGNVTSYEYDDLARRTKEIDAYGNETTFTYDIASRITAVTKPNGATTSYLYDDEGNVLSETDALGNTKYYEYDNENRKVKTTSPYPGGEKVELINYYADGKVESQIDPKGNKTSYEYDSEGRAVRTVDALGSETRKEYDISGNVIKEIDNKGNVTSFEYDLLNRLVKKTDKLGNSEVTEYDILGRVSKTIDKNGAETRFEYDALGRTIKTIDALGNYTTSEYDAVGNVISQTDKNGNITTSAYDPNGNRVYTTNPRGFTSRVEYDALNRPVRTIDALGNSTSKVYDNVGNVVSITDPKGNTSYKTYDLLGRTISETNRNGNTTTFTYGVDGTLTSVTDALGGLIGYTYDKNGNQLTETDQLGRVTRSEYDALNRKVKVINALGGELTYNFDSIGNLISTTDPNGNTIRYEHDAEGQLVRETDALGNHSFTEYDPEGNVVRFTDRNGYNSYTEYDLLGRSIKVTNPEGDSSYVQYDPNGNKTKVTNFRGYSTLFEYDQNNNKIAMIDAMDGRFTYEYDALDRLVAETNPRGATVRMDYDQVGNFVLKGLPEGQIATFTYDAEGNNVSFTNGEGFTTLYTFDALERAVTETDPLGNLTSNTYDPVSQIVSITNANGNTDSYEYDELNRLINVTDAEGYVTNYGYDPNGNKISTTDANNNTTYYEFDGNNRLVKEANPVVSVWYYVYDPEGNLVKQTDANGNSTWYEFDGNKKMTAIQYTDFSQNVSYEYDENGNMIKMIDPQGTTTLTYDPLDREVNKTDVHGFNTTKTYDSASNEVGLKYPSGDSVVTEYNLNNWPVKVTDPEGYSTRYTYDNNGSTVRIDNDNDTWTEHEYDAAGRMIRLENFTNHREQPRSGRPLFLNNGNNGVGNGNGYFDENGLWVKDLNDPYGQLRRLENPSNSEKNDPDGQSVRGIKTEKTTGNPNGNSVFTPASIEIAARDNNAVDSNGNPILITGYLYVLDPVGNRIQILESYTNGQEKTNVKTYTYSKRNELLKTLEEYEGLPSSTEETTYSYDGVGNRLTMTDSVDGDVESFTYTYDSANRMVSANDVTFEYDKNGNRIQKYTPAKNEQSDIVETYKYDFENRMTEYVRKSNNNVDQTVYSKFDGLGRRVEKGTKGANGLTKWVNYALDGLSYDQIAEYPETGHPIVMELYRGLNNELISMNEKQGDGNGSQYWFAQDGLESVSATTKQDGQSTHEYFYDEFGNLIDENGHWEDSSSWTNPHNHYLLSGKEWDEESRLNYFGARFYDAEVGVWITPDPLRGSAAVPSSIHPYFALGVNAPNQVNGLNNPMSSHRYLYVQNNPLNKIDPLGYQECSPYAKCRTLDTINPFVNMLFNNPLPDGSYQRTLNIPEFLDDVVDIDFPDKFEPFEDWLEDFFEFEITIGYESSTDQKVSPKTGQIEAICKEFSPFISGTFSHSFTIPNASISLFGYEAGLFLGLDVGGKLEGNLEACAPMLSGSPYLPGGYVSNAGIDAVLEFAVYLNPKLDLDAVELWAEAGIEAELTWPLLSCGTNPYNHQFSCENNPKESGYLGLFATGGVTVDIGGFWDYEYELPGWEKGLMEGEFQILPPFQDVLATGMMMALL